MNLRVMLVVQITCLKHSTWIASPLPKLLRAMATQQRWQRSILRFIGNRFMRLLFRKGSTEKSHLTLFGIIFRCSIWFHCQSQGALKKVYLPGASKVYSSSTQHGSARHWRHILFPGAGRRGFLGETSFARTKELGYAEARLARHLKQWDQWWTAEWDGWKHG